MALIVVASVAILLALLTGYVRRAAVDSDQFANRATAALQDDSVRSLVAAQVTDELVLKSKADLIAARPVIQSVVSSVVGGDAFTGTFRAGVRDVHRGLFDGDQNTVTLTVADIGTIVGAALQAVQPSVAGDVESTNEVKLVSRNLGNVTATAARAADAVKVLALVLLLVAVFAAAGALYLSADRPPNAVPPGIAFAHARGVRVVGLGLGHSGLVDGLEGPEARSAAAAVWDAFLADLRTAAWILAASGAVVAAAAASLIRPVDIEAPLRRAAAWITREPTRPAYRILRAVGLVAVGLLFVLDHEAVLELVFTLAGLYLIYAGVSAIL